MDVVDYSSCERPSFGRGGHEPNHHLGSWKTGGACLADKEATGAATGTVFP